jgi:hypothetical protein
MVGEPVGSRKNAVSVYQEDAAMELEQQFHAAMMDASQASASETSDD